MTKKSCILVCSKLVAATVVVARETEALKPARGRAAAMILKSLPSVLDIRTVGLAAGIDLASRPDAYGKRAYDVMDLAFHEIGVMVRVSGETLALSPPLIVTEAQIGEIFDKVGMAIRAVG
jgi:beta-alanine--pyruvate transaminase